MPEEIFTEKIADKWIGRLEKKPLLIFLFLSLSSNIWNEISKRNAENNFRADLRQKDLIISQKEAEIKTAVMERDMSQEKTIIAQEKLIQLFPYLPHGSTPATRP